jgi:release factor glutamine methyltransferase
MLSIAQWLQTGAAELATASPSARLDAELLLMYVCALTRTELLTRSETFLSPQQEEYLRLLLARRQEGEPIAYVLGRREFWSLELAVSPATLIPRPETEVLVERALALIPPDAAYTIADLGTGSGAIAVVIARERPHCRIIASDISAEALAVARKNADRYRLYNIEFRQGAWFTPLPERLDLVVSNPPYIRDNDPHLSTGDVRFEPRPALRGGPDGLDEIRRIAAQATYRLRAGGWLLLEHGFDQKQAVADILRRHRYQYITDYRDYSGLDRVIEAYRKPTA